MWKKLQRRRGGGGGGGWVAAVTGRGGQTGETEVGTVKIVSIAPSGYSLPSQGPILHSSLSQPPHSPHPDKQTGSIISIVHVRVCVCVN